MAELIIDVQVDKNGEIRIKKLKQETDKLETSTKKATNTNKGFSKSLAAATIAAAAIAVALKKVVDVGFDYNKQIEEATAGLTALTVATSSNTSALGVSLTLQEKYNLATKESVKTMKELESINAQTPHTLGQTNKIYKSLYVSMKKAGASNKEMIALTKQLSIAAGAAGIEFQSLLAGVDGLATGTVLANSDLGRFLGSLGLTNKTLKESENVTALLLDKLSGFQALDTYAVATSNFENSWDKLAGTLTEDIYVIAKDGLNSLSIEFDSLTQSIKEFKMESKNVSELNGLDEMNAKAISLGKEWAKYNEKYKSNASYLSGLWLVKRREIEGELSLLNDKLLQSVELKKSNDELVKSEEKSIQVAEDYVLLQSEQGGYLTRQIQATKDLTIAKQQQLDAMIVEAEETDTLNRLLAEQSTQIENIANRALKTSEDAWIRYYETIGNAEEEWSLKSEQLFEQYKNIIGEEKAREMADAYKKNGLDKMEKDSKSTWEDMQKTLDDTLTSGFQDFFDVTSEGFGDLESLGKDVINSIYQEMLKKQVAQPISSALTSGLGSIFGFADGGVMSSQGSLPLNAYASGGIATDPQVAVFGEGSTNEAFVPLPDGRSIPVTMSGGGGSNNTIINLTNESGVALDLQVLSESMSQDGTLTIDGLIVALNNNPDLRSAVKGVG